mmetsp:Transcript_15694/g.26268  ORF Transcript_15694/g.26268 Transcript_15694/m.26268 type:complete len:160 (+) Transcript_15694:1227-1706(+)
MLQNGQPAAAALLPLGNPNRTMPLPALPSHQRPRPGLQSIASRLRNTAAMPPIPTHMPESMAQLLHEHMSMKLDRFANAPQRRGWGPALKVAYGRRAYLMKRVRERATNQRNSFSMDRRMDIAVAAMDDELKAATLSGTSQYHKHLKRVDPATKGRSRN